MKYDKIKKAYEETFIGKEFVYKSKYGSTTFGKVSGVQIIEKSSMDYETSRKFKIGLAKTSSKIETTEKDYKPVEVKKKWFGSFPQINIISKNGNHYNIKSDEIYFIN